jgi:hypothetical protein
MFHRMRSLSCVLLATASLGACSLDQAQHSSLFDMFPSFDIARSEVASETLLQAGSFSSFRGLKVASASYSSPAALHAAARGQVNPTQIARSQRPYTQRIRLSDIRAASSFRVLELKPRSNFFNGGGFQLASVDIVPGERGFIPTPGAKPSYSAQPAAHIQIASAADAAPVSDGMEYAQEEIATQKIAKAVAPRVVPSAEADLLKVTGLTMGDYEDKTRLVLDLNQSADFDYDLNNLDSILTVRIDGAGWNMPGHEDWKNHPLVKG